MIAMISPSYDAFNESLSTLKFATRAKRVKNEARVNEDGDQRALLRRYELELIKLRAELLSLKQNGASDDKGGVLKSMEQQRQRLEADKMAAIQALEVRSKEFERERREKAILEAKIKALTSQVLIGGEAMEDSPAFQFALEEKQRLIRQEYEDKLVDLEKERNQLEDNKVHIERYKHLLLKQRDILLNMTQRLNERDESIIAMQKELASGETKLNKVSKLLVQGTSRIKALERILNENGIQIPNPGQQQGNTPDLDFNYESPLKITTQRSVGGTNTFDQNRHFRSKSPHEIVLRNAPWTDTVERNNRTTTSGNLGHDDEDFYGNNFEYNSSELEQYKDTSSPSRSANGNTSDNNTGQ